MLRKRVFEQKGALIDIRVRLCKGHNERGVGSFALMFGLRIDGIQISNPVRIAQTASLGDDILDSDDRVILADDNRGICQMGFERLIDLEIEYPRGVTKGIGDRIDHSLCIGTSAIYERQIIGEDHGVHEETNRFGQLQIDDAVTGGSRVEEHDRVHHTIGMISGVGTLFPHEAGLAVIIAEDISLGLFGSTERIEVEVVMQYGITGTTSGTKRNLIIAAFDREIKGRLHLIGPAVRQAFDIPLIGLNMICLADECISGHVVDLLYPRRRSIEGHAVDTVTAVHVYLRIIHHRDRVGSQRRSIEREETGVILNEHTIDYIKAVIVHTGIIMLVGTEDILIRQGAIGTTVFLVIGICPTIVKSVRRLKLGVDGTTLHTFEFTIGATEGEIGVTEVRIIDTVISSEPRCDGTSVTGILPDIDTDRSPFFPNDRSSRALERARRHKMPSLLCCTGL